MNTAIETDTPVTEEGVAPLGNVAMLAKFKSTSIGTQKKDKEASTTANQNFGIDNDAGYYSKAKIAKDYMSPIRTIIDEARKQHRKLTLPWEDGGERLLPNKNFQKHAEMVMYAKSNLASAAFDLEAKWPEVLKEAEDRLGPLFNPDEYPEKEEVADLFTIETDVRPVPTGDHFSLNKLVDTEKNLLKAKLEKMNEQREIKAKKDTWFRLYDVVAAMNKKLIDSGAKRYHKTLISNIEDVLEILPGLNIANDPNLDKMMEDVNNKLCQYDPSQFSKDPDVKQQAAEESNALLENMRKYMGANTDEDKEPHDLQI